MRFQRLLGIGALALMAGCSKDPASTKSESGPATEVGAKQGAKAPLEAKTGSPPYESVTQNITQYMGKRVRWYGKFSGSEAKEQRGGTITSAVYIDDTTDFTVTLHAFAVEKTSEGTPGPFSLMAQFPQSAWVTGTLVGTRNIKITVGSPAVEKELQVPLLRDPEFEEIKK